LREIRDRRDPEKMVVRSKWCLSEDFYGFRAEIGVFILQKVVIQKEIFGTWSWCGA
jgi:hypothetical protein